MEADNVLSAIIGVAAALIGFTGVIFAVGRFSQGTWKPAERHALLNLVMPSLLALFLAFLPMVAATGIKSDIFIWRFSNGLLAAIHVVLVTNALIRALRSELAEPVPLSFVLIPLGYVSVVASAAVALGFMTEWAVMIFVGGLVWFLFIAAIQFVMLVTPQPVLQSEKVVTLLGEGSGV